MIQSVTLELKPWLIMVTPPAISELVEQTAKRIPAIKHRHANVLSLSEEKPTRATIAKVLTGCLKEIEEKPQRLRSREQPCASALRAA